MLKAENHELKAERGKSQRLQAEVEVDAESSDTESFTAIKFSNAGSSPVTVDPKDEDYDSDLAELGFTVAPKADEDYDSDLAELGF